MKHSNFNWQALRTGCIPAVFIFLCMFGYNTKHAGPYHVHYKKYTHKFAGESNAWEQHGNKWDYTPKAEVVYEVVLRNYIQEPGSVHTFATEKTIQIKKETFEKLKAGDVLIEN